MTIVLLVGILEGCFLHFPCRSSDKEASDTGGEGEADSGGEGVADTGRTSKGPAPQALLGARALGAPEYRYPNDMASGAPPWCADPVGFAKEFHTFVTSIFPADSYSFVYDSQIGDNSRQSMSMLRYQQQDDDGSSHIYYGILVVASRQGTDPASAFDVYADGLRFQGNLVATVPLPHGTDTSSAFRTWLGRCTR